MEGLVKNIGLKISKGLFIEKGLLKNPYSFPAIIEDGNTVAWYLSDDLSTITKDGSDLVSVWADKLGSGHDLIQNTGINQPLWVLNDGILFDGIAQFMKTATFTFNQPEMIYIVFRQITWTNDDRVFDGDTTNSAAVYQSGTLPDVKLYAGSTSGANSDLIMGVFGIARVLFNGANSSFQINETPQIVGNFGLSNMGGFTLGSRGAHNIEWSNIQVKEIILRKIADSAQDEQDIYDYLAAKYSI